MAASTGLSLTDATQQTWQEALASANQTLTTLANQATYGALIEEAFGNAGTDAALFADHLEALRQQLSGNGLGLTVELRSNG